MTDEQVYNLAEAAAACSVSLPTIRRRKDQLVEAGAVVDPKGWRIPHSALIAAGFDPSWTADEKPPEAPVSAQKHIQREQPNERIQALEDRCRRLEAENAILRHHVDKWQVIAAERQESLTIERGVLRALTRTPQLELEPPPEIPKHETTPAPPERESWWKRTFG